MKMSEVMAKAQEILEAYGDISLCELEYELDADCNDQWRETGGAPIEGLTVRMAPFSERMIVVTEV